VTKAADLLGDPLNYSAILQNTITARGSE
jgi:hypothetical protein